MKEPRIESIVNNTTELSSIEKIVILAALRTVLVNSNSLNQLKRTHGSVAVQALRELTGVQK